MPLFQLAVLQGSSELLAHEPVAAVRELYGPTDFIRSDARFMTGAAARIRLRTAQR